MGKNKEKANDEPNFIEKFVIGVFIKKAIKKLNNMELKGSWRTSLVGWLTLIGTFVVSAALPVLDGNPATQIDMDAIIQALANAGIVVPIWLIGLLSRDKGVSSEEQKASAHKK